MITIVDTGIANVGSIKYKLFNHGIDSKIGSTSEEIIESKKLILPGVGHFKEAMTKLKERDLISSLTEAVIVRKVPILGICLGMQLFARSSTEGNCEGLGWLNAEVKKFDHSIIDLGFKIPHVGWNQVEIKKKSNLFLKIPSNHDFYFTHSYHMVCNEKNDVLATTKYGKEFTSMIRKDNILGTQFHPEKSHEIGFEIIINFIKNNEF